ncbi:MAG: hypothetical protein QOD93_7102 [Acetobacteraceae bacterium]|jgi:hypothetical protein|nr:hypothetical protein [Acetobacteraceae bacterium]
MTRLFRYLEWRGPGASSGLDLAAFLGTQQAALPPTMPPAETLRQSSVRTIEGRLGSSATLGAPGMLKP